MLSPLSVGSASAPSPRSVVSASTPSPMPAGSASALTTGVNMAVNVIGAGLLSMPWCLSRASVLPGLGLMALVCLLSGASVVVICACAERARVLSFVDLGTAAAGPRFGRFSQVVAAVYAAGSCISDVVLIGDFVPTALVGLGVRPDAWYARREALLLAVGGAVLLPLSLSRNLSRLRYSSLLALVGILFSCGVIVWRGLTATPGDHPTVPAWRLSYDLFEAAPVLNGAFIMQYNAPRYYEELHRRSLHKMAAIVACVFGFVLLLYMPVAYYGVRAFGTHIEGDVFNNFSRTAGTDAGAEGRIALATRLALAVVISCTFPMALHSLRLSVGSLLFSAADASRRFVPITLALVVAAGAVGCAFKDVAQVLRHRDALAGTLLVYVYPAVTYTALLGADAARLRLLGPADTTLRRDVVDKFGALQDPEANTTQSTSHDTTVRSPGPRDLCAAPCAVRVAAATAILWALGIMVLGII